MASTFVVPFNDSDYDYDPNNSEHDYVDQQQPQFNNQSFTLPNDLDTGISPHTHQNLETPATSASTLNHHQSSDISDVGEDPFFGVGLDLGNSDAVFDSFFQNQQVDWNLPLSTHNTSLNTFAPEPGPGNDAPNSCCPLTPEHTASIHSASPEQRVLDSISPQMLQKPFKPNTVTTQPIQMTPSQSSSGRSSEDSLAPAPYGTCEHHTTSPRVTVSVWDHDDGSPAHVMERSLDGSPNTLRGSFQYDGDLISSGYGDGDSNTVCRDASGRWQPDAFTAQGGIDPRNRGTEEVVTINELSNRAKVAERNQDVDRWLSKSDNLHDVVAAENASAKQSLEMEQSRADDDDSIPLGNLTENQYKDGQTYYSNKGGQMNEQDHKIIIQNDKWADAPMLPMIRIPGGPSQPESSQAAIERFERMRRDVDADSLISRSATWGTRRRSIHSIADFEMENILSGNFLKKLSISRGGDDGGERGHRAGNLLKEFRNIVGRPSISSLRKRRGSHSGDDGRDHSERQSMDHRDSIGSPHLAPPDHTTGWGRSHPPSINDALLALGNRVVHMGAPATRHSRNGSVSAVPQAPPRGSLFIPKVGNTLIKRPRSRSEAPKAVENTGGALISMLKKSGGPPVPAFSKATANTNHENDDDDDDDDDSNEESDLKMEANLIDNVDPTLAGFQAHILRLNPHLEGRYDYLVERIAHHQVTRYKALLTLKVKHLQQGANCPCGSLCMALGGQANVLDQRSDPKVADTVATSFMDDEDNETPTDGAINQESFPQDIPLPPTQYLPAEFECQLCYTSKKFHKPSDWTKHVHEDVQPFTCTWDRCRDPKSFKRKADWVRHENEGHRHLEWWTCDVDECHHVCYRRDNFLQHLVREHKFQEPKYKSKAAVKKAGGIDPTLQKVEQCHVLTSQRPQEEACRFCDKVFPTWKKLTVHLAKHMENISLPVLRLVAAKAKEISEDTIISPVEELPQRPMLPMQSKQNMFSMGASGHNNVPFVPSQAPLVYPPQPQSQRPSQPQQVGFVYPTLQQGQAIYTGVGHFDGLGHTMGTMRTMGVASINEGFEQSRQMQSLPVTTVGQYIPGHDSSHNQFMNNMVHGNDGHGNSGDGGLEPFPSIDSMALHNPNHNHINGQPGAQMMYNNMIEQSTPGMSPFSGQGSVSPYIHSPNMQAEGLDNGWDNRRMSGYR